MTRNRLLLLAAAGTLVLGACSNTPTSTSASPAQPRFDEGNSLGGNTLGSGNAVPTDTTQRGGNTLGSGN
jgi:hypothetical protein